MDGNWALEPLSGLGKLRFGASPADVSALAATYGVVEGEKGSQDTANVFGDTKALFGNFFSDEDLAAGEDYAKSVASGPDELTQTLAGSELVLDFAEQKLVGIIASPTATLCNFQNELVFDLSSVQLLSLFENANGGPGRYESTGAAFDKLAVYLDSFTTVAGNGTTRPLTDADTRFRNRTIALRATPYAVTEFLPGGRSQSFSDATKAP